MIEFHEFSANWGRSFNGKLNALFLLLNTYPSTLGLTNLYLNFLTSSTRDCFISCLIISTFRLSIEDMHACSCVITFVSVSPSIIIFFTPFTCPSTLLIRFCITLGYVMTKVYGKAIGSARSSVLLWDARCIIR